MNDSKQNGHKYVIEVLHGQLDKDQQEAVMCAFKDQQIQNFSGYHYDRGGSRCCKRHDDDHSIRERFGLAQLHQLRGRVGRSDLASFCYLIANPTTDQGHHRI